MKLNTELQDLLEGDTKAGGFSGLNLKKGLFQYGATGLVLMLQ